MWSYLFKLSSKITVSINFQKILLNLPFLMFYYKIFNLAFSMVWNFKASELTLPGALWIWWITFLKKIEKKNGWSFANGCESPIPLLKEDYQLADISWHTKCYLNRLPLDLWFMRLLRFFSLQLKVGLWFFLLLGVLTKFFVFWKRM